MSEQIIKQNNKSILSIVQGEAFKKQIASALPKHMTADRMLRVILTELRKNKQLMKCEQTSLFAAIVQCSQLGLEPGNSLGHAYLIPYGKECQLQFGYKGLTELALRSGKVTSVTPRAVYENDIFEIEYGLEERITHKPNIGDRGNPVGYYAVARFKNGQAQFEYMSCTEINKIRDTCSQAKYKDSPWKKYYDAMAKKTVIKQLLKYIPVSIELQTAINLDEQADAGVRQAFDSDVDVESESIEVVTEVETPTTEPETKTPEVFELD